MSLAQPSPCHAVLSKTQATLAVSVTLPEALNWIFPRLLMGLRYKQVLAAPQSQDRTQMGLPLTSRSACRQNTVQVGLTPDGPLILHQTFTTGKQDGQPFFGLRETTITPTAEGGPDIIRLNLGRKILHRGEAV